MSKNDTADTALQQENRALRERLAAMEQELATLRRQRDRALTQTEQALIESEARYRTLVETSPGAILLTSVDGMIHFCNQQAAQLFGYASVAALCGKHKDELSVLEHGCSDAHGHIGQPTQGGHLKNIEHTMCRSDGSRFPAEVSSAVVRNQRGTPTGLIIVVRDISEQKQAEQALTDAYNHLTELNEHLSRSRNLLQALFDGLEDGLLLLDSTGAVQMVNRALATLLGSVPQKVIGQNWSALYPRLAPDFPDHLALNPPENGRTSYRHTRYRNLDGVTRILNVQTIALRDPNQMITHVIVHVADVTETVQLQAQVIENERFAASGRLAASVAHEINTPLQSIQTALGLIRVANNEDRATYLGYALEETQRVARIVRQLLDLYRPSAAMLGPVDVNALIERLLLLISKRLRDQRITVERALAPDLPSLQGRADELMQVLLNLMVNAIEAMPDGGQLRIGTRFIGRATGITISDTGCGITPQMQARIFEPFVTTKEDGTGLGLSICAQLVQQHHGTITVESQPGRGSTFRVVLPLHAEQEEHEQR